MKKGLIWVMIICFALFLTGCKLFGRENADESAQSPAEGISKDSPEFYGKLNLCLGQEEMDEECKVIFTYVDLESECANSLNPDQCYYKAVLFNVGQSGCSKIAEDKLREECNQITNQEIGCIECLGEG